MKNLNILPVEEARDNDLNGLIAQLTMHGYNLRFDTDFSVITAVMRQCITLEYFGKYSYAKLPCKITVDYRDILLSLLESVNRSVMND